MAEPITNVLGVVGMKTRGEYNSETSYEKLNVVTYNGSSYCAKTSTQGNLPTDTIFWDLIAEKGDKGDKGDTPIKGTDYYTAADKAELEATLSTDVTSEVTDQLSDLTSATPIAVSSTSGMTDTSRIYVLTTDGHWYWYNSSETDWVDGGVYQSTGISAEEIENINIKSKNIKPNNIVYFKGYDLADRYNPQPSIAYDANHRVINPSDQNYTYRVGDSISGRCIKTRIPQNTYITINKEISDGFRVALYVNEPQNGSIPGKLICDDTTITNIGFNTEIYNWMVVFYSIDNDADIDIEVLIENVIDYDTKLREADIDIFDKVYSDNLFDESMIHNSTWIGHSTEGYRYSSLASGYNGYKSVILPLNYNESYTIIKSLTGKFRVGLFLFYPVSYDFNDLSNHFKMFPNEIVIDDESETECTFNSGNYRYCVITYTFTNENVDMTITNSSNSKYVLKEEYIKKYVGNKIPKIDGGYVISDSVNALNELWTNWNSRLAFGMNPSAAPVPVEVNSQLLVNGTCIVRNLGNQSYNRWGFHVYEAYGNNNYDRITMLLNKHDNEISKKVAELYYYTGSSHYASSYAWFRLGSDVKNHSFMFDRDTFVAYGVSDLRNVMTLARISPTNDLITDYDTVAAADAAYEPEINPFENAKCLLYIALRNAENGSMFYDTDRDKIVVKVNNVWCDMDVTPVPDGTYNF